MVIKVLHNSNISQYRNGVISGAFVVLIVSILHSREFRLDVWAPVDFMAWYALSLLIGGVSGFVGSLLLGVIPVRIPSAVEYGAGALLGLLGYVLQLYVFLTIVFGINSWQ